jgi:hypothetical protein
MWTTDVPTEPGHYWIKLNNGWQEIVLGQRSSLNPKKIVFSVFNTDLAVTGESLIKDKSRFWSDPVKAPELQPEELLQTNQQSYWE